MEKFEEKEVGTQAVDNSKDRIAFDKAFAELRERLDLKITEGGHAISTNRGLCGASVHMPYTYAALRLLGRGGQ
jgi:hypothetical protein